MNCFCENFNKVNVYPLPAIARPLGRGGRVCDSVANLINQQTNRDQWSLGSVQDNHPQFYGFV